MCTFLKFVRGLLFGLLLATHAYADEAPATFHIIAPANKATGLDEIVRVHVNGDKPINCKDLTLLLGDYPGLAANCLVLPGRDVIFTLGRNEANRVAWREVIGSPFSGQRVMTQPVSLSLGQTVLPWAASGVVADVNIKIERYSAWLPFFTLILVCGAFIILLFASYKSTMLRDESIVQFTWKECPYSLGRVQMLWWFFLTVLAFAFVFSITGTTDALNAESLALMGISGATALGAIAIDTTKDEMREVEQKVKELGLPDAASVSKLREKSNNEITGKGAAKDEFPYDEAVGKDLTYRQLYAKFESLVKPIRSRGLRYDLVTDVRGATLHRWQLLIWTIILGFIFLFKTYLTLETPLFGATLLGLMGISGGLYLGFKLPEKQAPKTTAKDGQSGQAA